jgi:hypothetical protein
MASSPASAFAQPGHSVLIFVCLIRGTIKDRSDSDLIFLKRLNIKLEVRGEQQASLLRWRRDAEELG